MELQETTKTYRDNSSHSRHGTMANPSGGRYQQKSRSQEKNTTEIYFIDQNPRDRDRNMDVSKALIENLQKKLAAALREIAAKDKCIEELREQLVAVNKEHAARTKKLEEELAAANKEIAVREAGNQAGATQATAMQPAQTPSLTLPDPEKDRGAYELWKDRENKNEKPLDFLRRVWGDRINAGVMYQSDLRGGVNKEPLDKRLFDVCWQQCRKEGKILNNYLPNKSKQIDREIETEDFGNYKKLSRLQRSYYNRKQNF